MKEPLLYTNPVHPEYFADPFVLRVGKEYFAYGTAPADKQGREFPILRSRDLVTWTYARHAIEPTAHMRGYSFWAPEVAQNGSKFYLYYSGAPLGKDEEHRLRVAVANDPAGPFVDSGKELLPDQGFSIDASPFRDPKSGKWFLFFATDYIEDAPHGTGLAVVPLKDDMLTVAGEPTLVVRGSCDWQVYERNRNYKGKVWEAWHCVEGPFVLFHNDKYYCLYSGGAWHTANYGVGFAIADNPMGPWTDEFAMHGPTVLKGIPERVIGPGHNSVVMGPDDRTLYCVYHAWDSSRTARRMCIDPLHFTATGPKCDGPSDFPREIFVR